MGHPKIIDIEAVYQHHTEKGLCVWADEASKSDIWLPLGEVEVEGHRVRGAIIEITGPEALFQKKGLI